MTFTRKNKNYKIKTRKQKAGQGTNKFSSKILNPVFMEIQKNLHEKNKQKVAENVIQTATKKSQIIQEIKKPNVTNFEVQTERNYVNTGIQTNTTSKNSQTQTNLTSKSKNNNILSKSKFTVFSGNLKNIDMNKPILEFAYRWNNFGDENGENIYIDLKDIIKGLSIDNSWTQLFIPPRGMYKPNIDIALGVI